MFFHLLVFILAVAGVTSQQADSCPALSAPDNGYLAYCTDGNNLGSVCNFYCRPGFIIEGSSVLYCKEDESSEGGSWNNPAPTCIEITITCPALSAPDNGYPPTCTDGTNLGSVCTFTCHPGFTPPGDSTSTCEKDDGSWVELWGTWFSRSPPACIVPTFTVAGREFTFHGDPKTWSDADADCRSRKESLIRIDSQEVQDRLNEFISASRLFDNMVYAIWSGGKKALHETEWRWTDGSSMTSYSNWMKDEPRDSEAEVDARSYVITYSKTYGEYIFHLGQWRSFNLALGYPSPYMCEKRQTHKD